MLSLKELKPYYPESLHDYERFIIREYLQYKILEIVFESPYENKLAFMGGTCLRIVHNNSRFSEDLDFDNFDLTMDAFNGITDIVEALHQTIASISGVLGNPDQDRTTGITGMVYRNIRTVTELVGDGLDALLDRLSSTLGEKDSSPAREAVLAALNGVLGDHLVARGR